MADIALTLGLAGVSISIVMGIVDCLKSDTYDNTGLLPYLKRKEVKKIN